MGMMIIVITMTRWKKKNQSCAIFGNRNMDDVGKWEMIMEMMVIVKKNNDRRKGENWKMKKKSGNNDDDDDDGNDK